MQSFNEQSSEQSSNESSDGPVLAKMRSGSIRSIIFDLDGVLIDSSAGIVDSTNYVLRNVDCTEREASEIKPYIGCPLPLMFSDFAPEVDYERIRPLFKERAREVIVQTSELLPLALEALQRLQAAGFEMAIGSTKIRAHIVGVIDKFNLGDIFKAVVGGDEAQPKPAPDIFQLALERLGSTKETTVVIGDTINDVLAAEAAGIPVVVVASEFGDPKRLEAHPSLSRVDDLLHFAEILCGSNHG